jgi:hypothetical protein
MSLSNARVGNETIIRRMCVAGVLTHASKGTISRQRSGLSMNVLLIEPILDRYVAQAERREKNWSPKEVEALLLKLRKEILDCLK